MTSSTTPASSTVWRPAMVAMFLSFALAYFLSTMVRAVTATLAPEFSRELGLSAGDLGLLSGAYFLGFSLTQLPLGKALDRFGSKAVVLSFLSVAALACWWFSRAQSLTGLVVSRAVIGVGVSACLMAPLTLYRQRLPPHEQLRANAWMLMTGSLGMLASTLPVHWLLPHLGWRGLFVAIGVAVALSMLAIAIWVPARGAPTDGGVAPTHAAPTLGYAQILAHPRFVQLLPVAFFMYGGMVAVQALWAGPWLSQVTGHDAAATAQGLFVINLTMLVTFFLWGLAMPRLARRGTDAMTIMQWGLGLPLLMLAAIVALGEGATAWMWAVWCVLSSVVTLSQPRIAQEFPPQVAGRALSAYNLVLFVGIFAVQWGLGMAIDYFVGLGWTRIASFRAAMGGFGVLCAVSYAWYLWRASSITRALSRGAAPLHHRPNN